MEGNFFSHYRNLGAISLQEGSDERANVQIAGSGHWAEMSQEDGMKKAPKLLAYRY